MIKIVNKIRGNEILLGWKIYNTPEIMAFFLSELDVQLVAMQELVMHL